MAKLFAALEATNPSSFAAARTLSRVFAETEPPPERALDAVDFETRARPATSSSLAILAITNSVV